MKNKLKQDKEKQSAFLDVEIKKGKSGRQTASDYFLGSFDLYFYFNSLDFITVALLRNKKGLPTVHYEWNFKN